MRKPVFIPPKPHSCSPFPILPYSSEIFIFGGYICFPPTLLRVSPSSLWIKTYIQGWRQAEGNYPFNPFYKLFPFLFFSAWGTSLHCVRPPHWCSAGCGCILLAFSILQECSPTLAFLSGSSALIFFLPLINVRSTVLSCTLYPSIPLISSPCYSVCIWDCSVLMSLSVTVFKDCIFREAEDGKDLLETVSSCLRKQESSRAGLTACKIGNAAFRLWEWHMCFFQLSSLVKVNLAYQNVKLPPCVKD